MCTNGRHGVPSLLINISPVNSADAVKSLDRHGREAGDHLRHFPLLDGHVQERPGARSDLGRGRADEPDEQEGRAHPEHAREQLPDDVLQVLREDATALREFTGRDFANWSIWT